MENIVKPTNDFDFSKISLAHPVSIPGGAYFTEILNSGKPLYILTPKTLTKQGFIKTGKKYYCDLMFDNISYDIINWFEKLEEKCHKLILEKSEAWFQGTLEENDIDNAFNPVIRVYKSGKFYLIRVNIKNNPLTNEPVIKIYNESENELTISDVTGETNVISILEIKGIKFTSRNFQIEIDIIQMMILDKEPLFNTCVIKSLNDTKVKNMNINHLENETKMGNLVIIGENEDNKKSISEMEQLDLEHSENSDEDLEDNMTSQILLENSDGNHDQSDDIDNNENEIHLEIEDLPTYESPKSTEVEEVDLDVNLNNNLESITLKKPNQVYYDLYREARIKAKEAKKNAIIAYLEAKNIKKTYMLENMDESDTDFEEELNDISENELEGL
jgi:hypothetical protein